MPRTRASGGVGGGDTWYERIINMEVDRVTNVSSVANRTIAIYTEVHSDCAVASIGLDVVDKEVGNFQLGVYDANLNLLCSTAVTAIATLTASTCNWIVPTTLPALTAGIHWLAVSIDSNYVNGVSGLQLITSGVFNADFVDSVNLGHQQVISQDAAYPLPNPLVPADLANNILYCLRLRTSQV